MFFFIHKRSGRYDYNGKYAYDSANQLVSSVAPDGKVTNYAYDAAGRMIKEGEKTYEYGWLDKVLKVTENGKTLADFEYHNNGQIAKAIRPDKTENFLWDGLALLKRDDTKFINEPQEVFSFIWADCFSNLTIVMVFKVGKSFTIFCYF